jgi:hypothetical protein
MCARKRCNAVWPFQTGKYLGALVHKWQLLNAKDGDPMSLPNQPFFTRLSTSCGWNLKKVEREC